jgi:hypothetical protein
MSMDFTQYEENYMGEVIFEIISARVFKTNSGTEGLELQLKGIGPASGYDLEKYDDPTGIEVKDVFWLPNQSDDKAKAQRKGGKVFRFLKACGFDSPTLDDPNDLRGIEVIGTVMNGDEGVAINFNRYKAV